MRRTGRTYITKDKEDITPLLPFFILDTVYQLYLKHILPLECSHDAQHWRSVWRDTYGALNREFFKAFDDDQRDAVIDRMESMEEFIAGEAERTRATTEAFLATKIPADKVFIVSVCMVCNVLAQSASLIWQKVYRDAAGRGTVNRSIEKLAHVISKFLNSWHKPACYINCNEDEAVDSAVTALQARVVGWLKTTRDTPQT
jgi:SH3-like domain-containing protein